MSSNSASYQNIRVDDREGVRFLIFNRPAKKNALSPEMHLEIFDALRLLAEDPSCRVLVLTGEGDSFCAGQDLGKFFKEKYDNPEEYEKFGRLNFEWGERLRLFPKPTIAMVNGWCIGAGMRIMCLCDLAVASDRSRYVLSEINFGLIPAGGTSKATLDSIAFRDAMYMALTGDLVSAEEADRMRLVNKVVPHEKLLEETMTLAGKLKEKDAIALMMTKSIIRKVRQFDYPTAVEYELMASHRHSFLQKRDWVDKGIPDFLEGRYKPGLESYKKKEPKEKE
jgi:feruloyl-CoA hydratase/lyase